MKKLYIPTTTLNFNNILSSESISPKAFYEKRGFGYHRWLTVEENSNDNCVLLYENLCSFERNDKTSEDHPLLVEIDADEKDFQQYADGVLYSDKTIYLDPWHTHFIFFSENDRVVTYSMSDSSLETKLVKLYKNYSRIESPTMKYSVPVKKDIQLNETEIWNDFRLNKMKGLLYGYYIGALLSSSKLFVKRLVSLRDIKNVFSAILSSPKKVITDIQKKQLDELFEDLEKTEPAYLARKEEENHLFDLLKELAPEKEMSDFQKIFDFYFWGRNISLSYCKEELIFGLTSAEDNNLSLKWVDREINEHELHRRRNELSVQAKELVVDKNGVVDIKTISEKDGINLFKAWCNETFLSKKYEGKISTFKGILADDITYKAKDYYQDRWTIDNPVRSFLNALRKHIGGENFDYKWDNNGLLYSVAAVLTGGDDWDKLLAFMQGKGMCDYRLAFAIYGELNGFANLTRDFTDILFNCDSVYISEVYREFHKQIFGIEIIEGVFDFSKQPNLCSSSVPEKTLQERVNAIIKEHPCVKMSEDEREAIDNALKKDLTDKEFIKLIDNDMHSLKNGIFPCLQKELYPDYPLGRNKSRKSKDKKNKSVCRNDNDMTLFSANGGSYSVVEFYRDKKAWSYIESLIVDSKAKEKIQEDLSWFQEQFVTPKEKRKFYKDIDEKDNNKVIDAFCRLKNGNDLKGKPKAWYFTDELRRKIENKLKDVYNVK